MPKRPKSICRARGCGALIDQPGYCERHGASTGGWERSHKGKTAEDRGYGWRWRKTRERILARDCGVCQPCLKMGVVHMATEVDHIVSKADARAMGWSEAQIEAESNLQSINKDCHKAKTARERGRGSGC